MKKTNIARLAVTAGLAFAMGAGMIAPATVAFADGVGWITINQVQGNDTTFDGYQIFTASVEDDTSAGTKKVSNVQWAGDMQSAVEGVIRQYNPTYSGTTAQDAADFIKDHISGTTDTTSVASDSFAKDLADALESSKLGKETIKPNEQQPLDAGYWLFVTTPNLADGEAATAPIFATVGGSTPVNVTEKDTVPTVTKTVGDDKATAGSTGVGKELEYHLTGSVASNIATYSTYYYKFTDTLSSGLDYKDDSAVVKIDGVNVTDKADISCEGNVLTVDLGDLKADYLKKLGVNLTKESKVTVDYKATVNRNAAPGSDKNNNLSNSVKLTYSNDPHFSDDGHTGTTTNNPKVKEYTYQLNLIKKDRDTEQVLSGAKFTLKTADGKYVQQDGSLADTINEFVTNASGSISVKGLDAGTYKLSETHAPDGYDTTKDVTITIEPTIPTSGPDKDNLTELKLYVADNTDAIPGESDGKTGDNKLTATDGTASDVKTGTVTVTVGDKKEITMPLTGMKGTTALMVYGSAILVISAAAYLKHKRNASNDDTE